MEGNGNMVWWVGRTKENRENGYEKNIGWTCTHEEWTHPFWVERGVSLNGYLCTLFISPHGQLMQWRWECQHPLTINPFGAKFDPLIQTVYCGESIATVGIAKPRAHGQAMTMAKIPNWSANSQDFIVAYSSFNNTHFRWLRKLQLPKRSAMNRTLWPFY